MIPMLDNLPNYNVQFVHVIIHCAYTGMLSPTKSFCTKRLLHGLLIPTLGPLSGKSLKLAFFQAVKHLELLPGGSQQTFSHDTQARPVQGYAQML